MAGGLLCSVFLDLSMLEKFPRMNRAWTRITAGARNIDTRWESENPAIVALRRKALELHIDPERAVRAVRPRALGIPAPSDHLAARVQSAVDRHRRLPSILHALALGAPEELAAVHAAYYRYFSELASYGPASKVMAETGDAISKKQAGKALAQLRDYAADFTPQATK
jgi:hypothetical protein